MKPEQAFYQMLSAKLLKTCPGIVLQRFENIVGCGVPDLMAIHNGATTWYELKVPVRGEVLLRKEQYAWGMRVSNAGGRVVVVTPAHMWEFPEIEITPKGKYLRIISQGKTSQFT